MAEACPKEEQPYVSWDTCDIAQSQVEHLIEQAKEEGEELTEDQAFSSACGDSDLYDMEWESLCECLTELMKRINPDEDQWHICVENFGWQRRNGEQLLSADKGQELLQATLPNTECSFKIYDREDHIAINNAHHDSPVWAEWYYIRPYKDPEEEDDGE